jgi:hypothetical protein
MRIYLYKVILPFLLALTFASYETSSSFAKGKQGIRSVDFYNYTYDTESLGTIILRKGRWKEQMSSLLYSKAKLELLRFVDLNNDGKEEAIIAIRGEQPSSMPVAMDYYVYDFHKGVARCIFHQGQEGTKGLCVIGRSLIITAPKWATELAVPHCCPEFTERKVYRLVGNRFVVQSRRQWKNYPFQHPKKFERLSKCK